MYPTLHRAIFSGWANGVDLTEVTRLLKAGHDVNGYDEDGCTPLIAAALAAPAADRSEAATRLLLENGADPDGLDEQGRRAPLHHAVCGAGEGTVRALLEGGADPDLPCGEGASPIHHAVAELARAGSAFDKPHSRASVCAAFVAVHIRALAAHGADLNLRSPAGDPPIAVVAAIPRCPDDVFDALLDAGVTTEGVHIQVDGEAMDLLGASMVSELSPHVAVRFVQRGCPFHIAYAAFGGRPFVEVVAQFRPDMAFALVRQSAAFADALVAHRSASGLSMLCAAAIGGHAPLMQWLVEHGLSVDEVTRDGRTPLDVARQHNPAAVAVLERLRP